MGKKAAYYEVAKNLYVLEGKTLEEIAEQLNVSVVTLSRWKREGNWDELRIKARAQRESFLELYQEVRYMLLKRLHEMLKSNPQLTDQTMFGIRNILAMIKPSPQEIAKQLDDEIRKSKQMSADEIKELTERLLKEVYGL